MQGGEKTRHALHAHSPLHQKRTTRRQKEQNPLDPNSAHLIGSDLLVNIRLLPDSVFQV